MGNEFTVSRSGIDLYEVMSAIQKEIRRGNERNCFLLCLDIIPKYEKYLWRRLEVIVQEDIGLADPDAIIFVHTQKEIYFEMRAAKKGESYTMVLANTIIRMCRAKKSRLADHFHVSLKQKYLADLEKPIIPDYAYDKHTRKGKGMGRGWQHFLEVGTELKEYHPDAQEDADRMYAQEFIEVITLIDNGDLPKRPFPPTDQRHLF